jgi:ActR/RegA family two-component response regulator
MSGQKILLVDDDETVRCILQEQLEIHGFEVVTASGVKNALQRILADSFDVLLTDLNMPGDGDGLTVVSAMRNAHPKAVTLVYSGYLEMAKAANAILLQADHILLKPLNIQDLIMLICERLGGRPKATRSGTESVASILETEADQIIHLWLSQVQNDKELMNIPLSSSERTENLPLLLLDLVERLRYPQTASIVAQEHGRQRGKQGYTVPLIVEESRMLQASIFQTIQNNLDRLDFIHVLADLMTIANGIDSQMALAIETFMNGKAIAHVA